MKGALRAIADWTVGPRLQEALGRAYRAVATRPIAANRALAGRHAGERRCFVIGNGPSIKDMDLKPLADEWTIGANSFYKHRDAAVVKLDYLCIFDPHFMIDQPRAVEWHRTLSRESPAARLLLHEKARPLVEKHGLYAGHEVYFLRSGKHTHEAKRINLDLGRPINIGNTTGSSVAIPLALTLGFKEVVLVGFDANWLDNFEGTYHFYEKHEYFPEFDAVSTDGRGNSYEVELVSIVREFESHRLLRQRAEMLGVKIVNATRSGRLDMYERRALEDVLKG